MDRTTLTELKTLTLDHRQLSNKQGYVGRLYLIHLAIIIIEAHLCYYKTWLLYCKLLGRIQ